MNKIRAPIKQRLEYILPVIIAIAILSVIMVINGHDYSGVSAAGLHGLTGSGQSSNRVTISNFPQVINLNNLGGVTITKHRSANNSPYQSGNTMRLTTVISFSASEKVNDSARISASAKIPAYINMKQNWILKCRMKLPVLAGRGSGSSGGIFFSNSSGSTPVGFAMIGNNSTEGVKTNYFGWSTVNLNGYAHTAFGKNGANGGYNFNTDTGSFKDVEIQYNASDGSMSCRFNGKTATMPSTSSVFRTNKSNTQIIFYMLHNHVSGTGGGTSNYGDFEFQSFQYTNYDREITSTELQDSAGRKITGPVGSGHTITVKHNLKGVKDNKFFNANRQASDNID